MLTIRKIQPQNPKNKWKIELDDGQEIVLNQAIVRQLKLHEGSVYDAEQVARAEQTMGFQLALSLLAKREYSQQQIREKLQRRHLHQASIDSVVQHLMEKRYLSDERFAEVFARELAQKTGAKEAFYKLREKGLAVPLVEQVITQFFELSQQEETAWHLVQKKRLAWQKKPRIQQKEKVFALLMRKGFDRDAIQHCWQRWQAEVTASTEA